MMFVFFELHLCVCVLCTDHFPDAYSGANIKIRDTLNNLLLKVCGVSKLVASCMFLICKCVVFFSNHKTGRRPLVFLFFALKARYDVTFKHACP